MSSCRVFLLFIVWGLLAIDCAYANFKDKWTKEDCLRGWKNGWPTYYDDPNYIDFLNQFHFYTRENASCSCYSPNLLNVPGEIRKFIYLAFEDLVYEKFGLNEYEYLPFYNISDDDYGTPCPVDSFDFNFRCGEADLRMYWFNRLYFALFQNAFFYSHYRKALLDFAEVSESYPYNYSRLLVEGLNATYSYLDKLQERFINLYNECLAQHPHPKIFYERGMIHAHRGNWDESVDDIRSAIELAKETPDNLLSSELYLQEGVCYAERGLYDQALIALTEALVKNPENKEAYFERAVVYFEKMEMDLALNDFISSEFSSPISEKQSTFSIDYAKGLTAGIEKGIQDEFGKAVTVWTPLLNMGLWALMSSPQPSVKFITATLGCVAVAGIAIAADQMVNELKDLVTNWDQLSQRERGELTGFLIGKYGVDIFAAYGSAKCMDAYNSLRKANQILTFEFMLAEKSNQDLVTRKILEQAAKRPQGKSIQAFNMNLVLNDKEKMKHIFAAKHQLDKLGEPRVALQKITDAVFHADVNGKIPKSGPFDISVMIEGHLVTVRGAIVTGELRYGTTFIPE